MKPEDKKVIRDSIQRGIELCREYRSTSWLVLFGSDELFQDSIDDAQAILADCDGVVTVTGTSDYLLNWGNGSQFRISRSFRDLSWLNGLVFQGILVVGGDFDADQISLILSRNRATENSELYPTFDRIVIGD